MYCQHCGSVLGENARFCRSCGQSQVPSSTVTMNAVQVSRQGSNPKGNRNPSLWLICGGIIILGVIASMIGRSPSDSSTPTALPSPAPSSAPSSTPQPQIVRPSVPPPKFRIYKFKIEAPTSVVVPVNATDEQLKSLLWLFREKVRSHQFKDIGLTQPTSKQWGNKGYLSGMLLVYRGEKCANEQYTNTISPCGYGEHDDAVYHWGLEADPNKDHGSISVKGKDIVVFDYKDGWRVAPEIQAQLDEQTKAEQETREIFARGLQQRLTSMGYDITVWVRGEGSDQGRELSLNSEIFKDTSTRVQFINRVLPAWKRDLCKVGFREVKLRQGGTFELGQDYSLGCENL
jgi:hypothetical protein